MFRAANLYPFHRWGIRGPGTAEVHLGRNPGLTTCTASPWQGGRGSRGQPLHTLPLITTSSVLAALVLQDKEQKVCVQRASMVQPG